MESKPLTPAQIEAKLTELRCSMPGYMRVTPKIAKKLLERTHEKQRPVDNHHVQEIVKALRGGTFTGFPLIKFDYNLALCDGQHSLLAVIDLKREVLFRIDFW